MSYLTFQCNINYSFTILLINVTLVIKSNDAINEHFNL